MITVYFLPVTTINNTDHTAGEDIIHDAILDTTSDPKLRKLIMNTTPTEHNALLAVCTGYRPPFPEEVVLYDKQVIIVPPDPDTLRAQELLKTSPLVITQPEIWELIRIFGKRLGYRFK